jgi:hypothetical protein
MQMLASHPLYNRNIQSHQFGSATVVDSSIDNSFQPRHIPQQTPLGVSQYPASPIYLPMQIMDDQSYGSGLSQGAIQKIQELKDC